MLQNMPWSRCQNSSIIRCLNTKVKTSVLCPGWVRTRILDASRNRPNQIQDKSSNEQVTGNHFHAISEDKFYILVNADEYKSLIRMRMDNILGESNPT